MASFAGAEVNPPDIIVGPNATVLPPVVPGAAIVATAGTPTLQPGITLSHTGGTLTRRSSPS